MVNILDKHQPVNGSSRESYISVHRRLDQRSRNLYVGSSRRDQINNTNIWLDHLICNSDIWLDHLIYHLISNLNNNMCRICLDCWVMNNLNIISGLLNWSNRSTSGATGCVKLIRSANCFRCKSIGTTRPTHIWEDSASTALAWSAALSVVLSAIVSFLPLYFTAKKRKK